jgi:hypothetical protein
MGNHPASAFSIPSLDAVVLAGVALFFFARRRRIVTATPDAWPDTRQRQRPAPELGGGRFITVTG